MKLKIKNVSKTYGKIKALDNISLELTSGIYGVLGPNGAGKSTLINLLTDNIPRESGDILLDGKDIRSMGSSYLNILGYMPQEQGYYEDFSAQAFLKYIAKLKGMKGAFVQERVDEVLEMVNLQDSRTRLVGGFSGGMRQRLLLAQSLLNDPKILILDEPTAGVDPQERIHIRNFISELSEDKIIILATHIVSDVEAIAKEIVLLDQGRIIKSGTPFSLIHDIQNEVLEIEIPHEQLKSIRKKYVVSNLRHTENGFLVKIICNQYKDVYNMVRTNANLEDVYLYFFHE